MNTKLIKLIAISSLFAAHHQAFAAASCTYAIDSEWPAGFNASITIRNTGTTNINAWDVNWQYNDGTTITNVWNAALSGTNPYSASNLSWNGTIAPQTSISIGMQGSKAVSGIPAAVVDVTGAICDDTNTNVAPIASFMAGVNGQSVAFDASGSSDMDGDALTYSWNFADGTTATGVAPTHVYEQAGTYDVVLSVSDGQTTTSITKTVSVTDSSANLAPVARATHVLNGLEISVDAGLSTDPNGDELTYSWNFGDNITGLGLTATHTYATSGSYTVALTVSDGEFSETTSFLVSVGDVTPTVGHVANPFLGATSYINPDYAKLIDSSIAAETDPELIRKMEAVKDVPTAIWLDRIEALYGGEANAYRLGLEEHLLAALDQKQANAPITISFVVYNLPDRDCNALASNGTLHADENGLAIYKAEYIDVIADLLADPRFSDLRIITTIEPDSLPNLVTNADKPVCASVLRSGVYEEGIRYALQRLSAIDNVYIYLDIAHSGWLGWDNNMSGAVTLYTNLVKSVANGDMSVIDGFVSNVANYTPTEEPNLRDPNFDYDRNGQPIRAGEYYEWNPNFDEKDYLEALHARFVASGFPQDVAMLIDTSRNGWGGANRPLSANLNAYTEDQYVTDSKIDRRTHRGQWCNVSNAGIGNRPQVLPYGSSSVIEAYVWIKPPGESDGTSDSTQTTADSEGKSFDSMCSSAFIAPEAGNLPTGAMDGAPSAGNWFPEQFKMLIENAYPEL